jgi:hypothetical protein
MGAPSGITRSRWDNLSLAVQKAVGKPLQQEFDCWEYQHEKPYYRAVVFVQGDQLVGRVWYDEPSAQPASAPTIKKKAPAKSGASHKPKKEKKKKKKPKQPTSQPEDQEPPDS